MNSGGLAQVFRTLGPAYLAQRELPRGGTKVWRAIVACRTAALGGHIETCTECGATRHVYHSCRNRHCPQCQTQAKEIWLSARRREVLPVPYFHLVFTLPHDLNGLIGIEPQPIYENLMKAVAATLTEFGAQPKHLGGEIAFTLVLHTWQQDLKRHVHIHALVAGGALTAEGTWIPKKKGFLFPVRALSKVFRGKFVAGLDALHQRQQWPLVIDWPRLRARLHANDWVVYAKQPLGGAEQVLEYLGRYTHKVAISNERIIGIVGNEVMFRVRADSTSGKKRTLRVPGDEFIRRFMQHVLPSGFKRIRHYGLLSPARKKEGLAAARRALELPPPQPAVIESVAAFLRRVAKIEQNQCPHCNRGQMRIVATLLPERRWLPSRAPP